jgi:hypothetical protein
MRSLKQRGLEFENKKQPPWETKPVLRDLKHTVQTAFPSVGISEMKEARSSTWT